MNVELSGSNVDLGIYVLEHEEVTAVFPAGNDPDQAIVRACKRVFPRYEPLWHRKVYRTPMNGIEVHGYHCLGMRVYDWHEKDVEPLRLAGVPSNWDSSVPLSGDIVDWAVDWPDKSQKWKQKAPSRALPYTWDVYRMVNECLWVVMGTEEKYASLKMAAVKRGMEIQKEALAKLDEESKYEMKQHNRDIMRCLDEGRWWTPPPDPKPFVVVGKHA